jgi:hypothetical protein
VKAFHVSVQIRASRRESHRFYVFVPQYRLERWAELAIPIHEHIPLAIQKTVKVISEISSDLHHPCFIGICRATSEVNTPRRYLHYKEQVVRNQSALGPHFNRREIDCFQHIPVGFQKRFPHSLPLSFWGWLDAVGFENVPDSSIRDFVAKIAESTLNPIVPPGWILTSHPQNELLHFLRVRRSSRLLCLAVTIVPFLGDKLPVPAQDRIWCYDSGNLGQQFTSQQLTLDGQARSVNRLRSGFFRRDNLRKDSQLDLS